jgi:hypothetical protein
LESLGERSGSLAGGDDLFDNLEGANDVGGSVWFSLRIPGMTAG